MNVHREHWNRCQTILAYSVCIGRPPLQSLPSVRLAESPRTPTQPLTCFSRSPKPRLTRNVSFFNINLHILLSCMLMRYFVYICTLQYQFDKKSSRRKDDYEKIHVLALMLIYCIITNPKAKIKHETHVKLRGNSYLNTTLFRFLYISK